MARGFRLDIVARYQQLRPFPSRWSSRSNSKVLPPTFFDSNGAGVALADLDDDSHLDIVLAGLQTPPTILWNRAHPG